MNNYNIWQKIFDETYDEIYDFIEDLESKKKIEGDLECDLIVNADDIKKDSYGDEDSNLARIVYFNKYDVYIRFYGTRCSYEGETWNRYEQVTPAIKEVIIYNTITNDK